MKTPRTGRTGGQAMIELMIGLVAVLALTAGLLQVATLTRAHTDVMVEARSEAGRRAVNLYGGSDAADYIRDWEAGADERRYTRDDEFTDGDEGAFVGTVVDKAAHAPDDWQILSRTANQDLSLLRAGSAPSEVFGLVHGHSTEDVELLPAVRSLLYRADSIDVESDVWMTWCTGVY